MKYCEFCSLILKLDVSCSESGSMDITSNMLDLIPHDHSRQEGPDPSDEPLMAEELSRRPEGFGTPVSKGEFGLNVFLLSIPSINIQSRVNPF